MPAGDASLVESCTLAGNSGFQRSFSGSGGYAKNFLTGGALVSGGVQLGPNPCNGVPCP